MLLTECLTDFLPCLKSSVFGIAAIGKLNVKNVITFIFLVLVLVFFLSLILIIS